jgi:hypothetical protein
MSHLKLHFNRYLAHKTKIVFEDVEYTVTDSYFKGAKAALEGTRLTSSRADIMGESRTQWRLGYVNQQKYQEGESARSVLLSDYRGDLKTMPSDRDRGADEAKRALKKIEKKPVDTEKSLETLDGHAGLSDEEKEDVRKKLEHMRVEWPELRSADKLPEFSHGDW